jgi:hypothetical protein
MTLPEPKKAKIFEKMSGIDPPPSEADTPEISGSTTLQRRGF